MQVSKTFGQGSNPCARATKLINTGNREIMSSFTSLIKESWVEVTENVTWPKFTDLQSSSILVLVASLIFALLVGVVDLAFKSGLDLFYSSF
jgi:preprotein translocase subunit SecE